MRLLVSATVDERWKFVALARALPSIWDERVLDVGYRTGNLHHVVFDLGRALPIRDHTRNTVGPRLGFEVTDEGCFVGPRRNVGPLPPLVRRFPNLLARSHVTLRRAAG